MENERKFYTRAAMLRHNKPIFGIKSNCQSLMLVSTDNASSYYVEFPVTSTEVL